MKSKKGKLIMVFHRKLNRSPKQNFMSPVKEKFLRLINNIFSFTAPGFMFCLYTCFSGKSFSKKI